MKKSLAAILGLAVLGALIYGWSASNELGQGNAADPKDATYSIEGQQVTLAGGKAQTPAAPGSASMVVTTYFGNEVDGDLNGDGTQDAAFILTQSGGGSGTFYYAVAALRVGDTYKGTNAVLLGDRIAPQSTEIKDGTVTFNYADRQASEPMTAQPSVGVSKHFKIENGTLVDAASN